MNKQTLISLAALLAAPALLIGSLRGSSVFEARPEPATTQEKPQAQPLADNTSADDPVDATSWVPNAKMNQTGGWQQNPAGGNFGKLAIPGDAQSNPPAVTAVTHMWEHWWGGGLHEGQAIYQNLTGLPNGKYQISMAAMITQGGSNPQVFVYANDAETKVTTAQLAYYTVECEVTDHALSLGLRVKAGNNGQWSAITDVSLTYLNGQRGILSYTLEQVKDAYAAHGTTDEEMESKFTNVETLLKNIGATAAECETAGEDLEGKLLTLLSSQATPENPYNMSSQLANPTFDGGHTNGWTINGYAGQPDYPRYGAGCAEFWHSAFDLNQTVTNLPAGQYRVSAQVAASTTNNVYVYAGENSASPTTTPAGNLTNTGNRFAANRENDRVAVEVNVVSGELKLGLRTEDLNNWIVFDDFRLEYIGEDAEAYAPEVAQLLEEARGMQENEMPESVKASLEAAIAAAEALTAESPATDYRTALAALRASIEEVEALAGLYPAYMEVRNECQHLFEITADNEARRDFEAAILASDKKVAEAEDAFVYRDETAALEAARQAFLNAGPTLLEGQSIDMTERLANPTFDAGNYQGWTQEGYSGEGGYPKYGGGAIEYWHCTFDLHQTVASLPDGQYRVSAQLAATTTANVEIYADELSAHAARQLVQGTDNLNGTGESFAANRDADRASVEALVLDGDLRLGIRTSALDNWIVFDDFRLEYLGENTEMYAEEVAKLADEARAMLDNEAPAQLKAELQQAVNTADALTPESGMAAYKNLIPVLEETMARMETASALYPAYADIVESIEDMLAATAASEAHTTLEAALQASAQRIDASTDVAIYSAETVTLTQAARAFVVSKPTVLDGQTLNISFMMENPTFDAANYNGWKVDNYAGTAGYPRFGGGAAEFWHAAFDLNQTMTGLPDGQYRISAQIAASTMDNVWLYANEISGNPELFLSNGQTLSGVGNGFATYREDNRVTLGVTILSLEDLKLGLRTEATDNWIVFDDFRLEYLGESVEGYAEELARLTEQGQGMLGMDAPAQVKAGLETALATAEDLTAENTIDEYKAAITGLRDAIELMGTSGGGYPAYEEMLAACQALLDATDDNAARQAFEDALQASADRLAQTTDETAYTDEAAALDAARRTFIAAGPDVAEGKYIDLTFMVQNPECAATQGWNPGKPENNFRSLTNAEKNGEYAGTFIEKWDPSANYRNGETPIYQTVGGLPEGVYSLRAAAFRTNQHGETPYYAIQLFLNDGAKVVKGDQLDYVETYGLVDANDNASATIGLRATLDNQANWCGICDVTLLYWGTDKEAYETYRQDVAGELANATEDVALNEGYSQMAAQALEDNAAAETDNAESLKAKIAALESTLRATYESIVPYEAYLAAQQETRALVNNSEGGDRETFMQSVEDCYANAEAATSRSELENMPDLLESIRQAYMLTGSRPLHGYRFDLTFAVPNMDFSDGLTGWQTDLEVIKDENFRAWIDNSVNSQYAGTFAERYYKDDTRLAEAAGKRAVYRTVSGMPAGLYSLEAAAFGQRVHIGNGSPQPGMISLYLNDESADVQSTKLDYVSTYSTLCEDGNLEFGLRTEEGNTQNWLGLGDVHLYYYGIPDLFLNSGTYNPVSHDTYAHVYLANEFDTEHWNTLCLPFDVTAEDQAAYFSEVREITGMEIEGTTCLLTTAPVTQMLAGKPYLVKPATTDEEMVFEQMHVLANGPQAVTFTEGDVTLTFRGQYNPTALTADTYACEEDYFVRPASTDGMSYRAYLTLEGNTTDYERILFDVGAEDLPTSIQGVKAAADEPVDVYSMDGLLLKEQVRRADALKGLPAGLYIVDGEKIAK